MQQGCRKNRVLPLKCTAGEWVAAHPLPVRSPEQQSLTGRRITQDTPASHCAPLEVKERRFRPHNSAVAAIALRDGAPMLPPMIHRLRGAIVFVLVLVLLVGACGAIRWARRGGTGAQLAASALLLTLGMGLVTTHPQRIPEQVQQERRKTDGESGAPPA
jgi:hypothetical protein